MNIHHFAYLFGTDDLLIKDELLVLTLSGNLDIRNICLCFNTCALAITQHLLMSKQCDLCAWLWEPEGFCSYNWCHMCSSEHQSAGASLALGQSCLHADRGPRATHVGASAKTHISLLQGQPCSTPCQGGVGCMQAASGCWRNLNVQFKEDSASTKLIYWAWSGESPEPS